MCIVEVATSVLIWRSKCGCENYRCGQILYSKFLDSSCSLWFSVTLSGVVTNNTADQINLFIENWRKLVKEIRIPVNPVIYAYVSKSLLVIRSARRFSTTRHKERERGNVIQSQSQPTNSHNFGHLVSQTVPLKVFLNLRFRFLRHLHQCILHYTK